jgi:hypothetical protein
MDAAARRDSQRVLPAIVGNACQRAVLVAIGCLVAEDRTTGKCFLNNAEGHEDSIAQR